VARHALLHESRESGGEVVGPEPQGDEGARLVRAQAGEAEVLWEPNRAASGRVQD